MPDGATTFQTAAVNAAKSALSEAGKKFPSPPKPVVPAAKSAEIVTAPKKAPSIGTELGEKAKNVTEYSKGVPTYKKGTKSVEKTGPAIVDKGEAIIPKDKAMKHRGLIEGIMDSKDGKKEKEGTKKVAKKPKHRVHTMHVKRAHGGFVINHEVEPAEDGSMPTAEQNPPHVVSDMDGLKAHMEEHMGGDEGGGALASAMPSAGMPQA